MVLETGKFRTTIKTYLALVHDYRYRKSWGYRLLVFGVVGVLLFAIIATLAMSRFSTTVMLAIVLTILSLWYFLFLDYLFPVWGFYADRKRGLFKHECQVFIDKDGIRSNDQDGEIKKPWHSIESIAYARNHIFVYFNKSAAFMIPETAFPSVTDAHVFFNAAITFHENRGDDT